MAKIKSSTKLSAPRKPAKTTKGRGPAQAPVPASPEGAAAADRASGTKQALVLGLLRARRERVSQSWSNPPAGSPTAPGRR
jgi:hypothetical protein